MTPTPQTTFDIFWNLYDNKKSRDKTERKLSLVIT